MRLLLDECMPRVLCADLPEHFCSTVSQMKWRGLSNGALLARASEEFDVFITVDWNLRYQQNLKKFRLAVIVIHARNNEYEELRHFVPKIRGALETMAPGLGHHHVRQRRCRLGGLKPAAPWETRRRRKAAASNRKLTSPPSPAGPPGA